MYKVLIVEDMDLTREDIMNLIDWKKYGFELLPAAGNGKTGLEYAKRYQPDIILTDIKMPMMTGLDMVEELKSQGSSAMILLLTAYEEFELAKRALRMGVQAFILKYEIDDQVLLRELNKCVEIIKNKKDMEKIKKHWRLQEFLLGKAETITEKENLLDWNGKSNFILLRSLSRGKAREERAEVLEGILEQLLPEERFKLLKLNQRDYVLLRQEKRYLSEVQTRESVRSFTLHIQKILFEFYGISSAAAVGGEIRKNRDILKCKEKAEKLIQGAVFTKGNCMIEEEFLLEKKELSEPIKHSLKQIEQFWELDEYEAMYTELEYIQNLLIKSRSCYWFEKAVDKLMYFIIQKSMQTEYGQAEEASKELKEFYKEMTLFEFLEKYREIADIYQKKTEHKYSGKTRYMVSYIQKNYAKEISLHDIAEEMGMNSIYLSQLFKKEMGSTFSAYLTKVRIQKAIELLKQGDYKIYEISELVGYQTVQYFSKVFKKETGKNPKDY